MLIGLFCWCVSGYKTNRKWVETCDENSVMKLGGKYYKVTELRKVKKGIKKDAPHSGGVG
jgi:hypothetical protein